MIDSVHVPLCSWSIQYGPADNGTLKLKASMKESRADQEYSAVITNLLMCTDYKITVQAVTVENDMGPPATAYTQTDDSGEYDGRTKE